MNVYGAIQNGCQSGQFPARPYCLFGETVDGVKPAAPLTPELTFSISPEMRVPMNGGGEVVLRADYSYRDEMFGEPSSEPGRFNGDRQPQPDQLRHLLPFGVGLTSRF